MLGLLTVVSLLLGALGQTEVEKITLEGYPVETHTVTTEDGYILELVRIPHGKNSTSQSKGVVFLMHGLLCSFNSFTYMSSEYSIAYNLADAGYDTWMGNARGNTFSRRHVSLDPDNDKKKFFDYTFEQIALLDLPALLDYVLNATNKEKLHYIGHSQGGTTFMILNSMKPEYQSKFASANLLSGNGYATHFPNKEMKTVCVPILLAYKLFTSLGYVELKPKSRITKTLAEILVNTTAPSDLIFGSSLKQGVHFCQLFTTGKFCRFNYDAGNLLKYGKLTPPSYDITKIKVNTTFYYSLGDVTQSETDVLMMAGDMPNARARKVAKADFDHLDYLINPNVKELVTKYVIESLESS